MPPLARTLIKTAFGYFVAAFVLGALMALDRWLDIGRWLRSNYYSQLHLLVVGWITQLAMGVAYWIFPRLRREQDARPRGSEALAWGVLICLNAGLLLRSAFEPFYLMGPRPWLAAVVAFSGMLQALAAAGFGWLIWGRIRSMER
jgi:hypothetical protein